MPPRREARTLSSREREALRVFLENAHGSNMTLPGWDSNWTNCHGEGRSSSNQTFHIAVRITSAREYQTCIKIGSRGGTIVAGSEVNWGQSRPSLQHILNHYKRLYSVDVTTSSSSSGSDDDRRGGRGGGGGGRGGKRTGYQKQVMKANDGSYFYLDEQEEYIPCTPEGQALQCSYRLRYDRKYNLAYYTGSDRKTHWYDGKAALAAAMRSYQQPSYQQSYSSGGYGRRDRY